MSAQIEKKLKQIIRFHLIRSVNNLKLAPKIISMQGKSRIFAIGLSKTGTSSLANAIHLLGYTSIHYPDKLFDIYKGKLRLNYRVAEAYECLSDGPVVRFYKELDKRFPGSKFILTTRDKHSWLKSCENHFTNSTWGYKIDQLNKELYGSILFDEELYSKAYDEYHGGVDAYFKHRQNDLLKINIINGDGWNKLCPFLSKEIPNTRFPWSNRTKR